MGFLWCAGLQPQCAKIMKDGNFDAFKKILGVNFNLTTRGIVELSLPDNKVVKANNLIGTVISAGTVPLKTIEELLGLLNWASMILVKAGSHLACLIAAVSLYSASAGCVHTGKTYNLDEETFDDFVFKSDHLITFVEFSSPWCIWAHPNTNGHGDCATMRDAWDQLGETYNVSHAVSVAEVDCSRWVHHPAEEDGTIRSKESLLLLLRRLRDNGELDYPSARACNRCDAKVSSSALMCSCKV